MQLRRYWRVAGALALCSMAAVANAQFNPVGRARMLEDLTNRPSWRGPSLNIGGTYTRYDLQPLVASRQTPTLLSSPTTTFRHPVRPTRANSRLETTRVGMLQEWGTSVWDPMGQSRSTAWMLSGMVQATNVQVPIPGSRWGQPAQLDSGLYTPRPETTSVQDMLGLLPVPADPTGRRVERMPDALVLENVSESDHELDEAIAMFRAATYESRRYDEATGLMSYPTCKDCTQKLYTAMRLLKVVRDVDRNAALPLVLIAHAHLEQEQPMQALLHLAKAYERDPRMFLERRPIDEYFGDVKDGKSVFLADQMRRFAELGALNPDSPEARLVEAYCAYRLGETDRMQVAATAVEQFGRTRAEYAGLVPFAVGLQASLRYRADAPSVNPLSLPGVAQPAGAGPRGR